MKSLMNKRADVTITTVILIVLGLVVLVMIILGFTKGTSFFFGIFDKGPSDLEAFTKACSFQVSGNLNVDFCKYQLTNILGDDEVVNCEHPLVMSALQNDGVIVPSSMTNFCADNKATFLARVCDKVGASKKEQTKINGGPENCQTGVPIRLILSTTTLKIKGEATGSFNVKLSSKPTSDVEISLVTTGSVTPKTLRFTSENWDTSQKVEFKAEKVDANKDVSIDLTGQNGLSGKVQVTITK